MAKKIKEEEVEVKVQVPPKKRTVVGTWFDDNCVNDRETIETICTLTARSVEEQFNMSIRSSNVNVYAAVFFATYTSILKFLKSKQDRHSRYTIEIANSINIGYDNNDSIENEKAGNFQPILEHIGFNRNIINSSPMEVDTTTKNFILWKGLNIKKNIEHCKEIQEDAYNLLQQDFRVDLRTSEAVMPIFCIFIDNMIGVLKLKYREAEGTDVSEVKFNVLGLFDVTYSFDEEDNQDIIEYVTRVTAKTIMKDDDISSKGL